MNEIDTSIVELIQERSAASRARRHSASKKAPIGGSKLPIAHEDVISESTVQKKSIFSDYVLKNEARGKKKKIFITAGVLVGIFAVVGLIVGILFAAGVLGGEHGKEIPEWKKMPFNAHGWANKAWCPSVNSTIDFNCQHMDMSATSIFAYLYVDMFTSDTSTVTTLSDTYTVICYISGGTYEKGRPDADSFPLDSLGLVLDDWPDEAFLDIRPEQPYYNSLRQIMYNRAKLAAQKGCQSIEWDNVDCWQSNCVEGVPRKDPTMATNQLVWNKYLADITHELGMSVGLKNDVEQIPSLVDFFDFAINEHCYKYDECDLMIPFLDQGKAVMLAIYKEDFKNVTEMCDYATSRSMMPLIEYRGDWWNCPVMNAVNGEWTDWSQCSQPCGGGIQTRECSNPFPSNNGAQCEGTSMQICNTNPCDYCDETATRNGTNPRMACENDGQCYIQTEANITAPACKCSQEFSGTFCETPTTSAYPCLYSVDTDQSDIMLIGGICDNEGSCIPNLSYNDMVSTTAFQISSVHRNTTSENQTSIQFTSRCDCPAYWAGPSCSTASKCLGPYDTIQDTPVCYHGSCLYLPSQDTIQCECDEEFVGTQCDIVDPCSRSTCLNSGSCEYDPTVFGWLSCTCTGGFTGPSCEIAGSCKLDCLNGGVCSYTEARGEFCGCPSWTNGTFCENIIPGQGPCDVAGCVPGAECLYNATLAKLSAESAQILDTLNGSVDPKQQFNISGNTYNYTEIKVLAIQDGVSCECQYPYFGDGFTNCTYGADLLTIDRPLTQGESLITECGNAKLTLQDWGLILLWSSNDTAYGVFGNLFDGATPYTMDIDTTGVVRVKDMNGSTTYTLPYSGGPAQSGPYQLQLTAEGDIRISTASALTTTLWNAGLKSPTQC
eukprot:CFRG0169T1